MPTEKVLVAVRQAALSLARNFDELSLALNNRAAIGRSA
jgi:hypothetical protein